MRTTGLVTLLVLAISAIAVSPTNASSNLYSPHELIFSASYLQSSPTFTLNLTVIRTEISGNGSENLEVTVERVAAAKVTVLISHPDVSFIESGVSTRTFQFQFPASLPTGTSVSISLSGLLTPVEKGTAYAAVSSNRDFQLLSAEALIPSGSSILGLQPNAHIREETSDWTKLRWNYVNKRFASYSISFVPPFDSSSLSVKLLSKSSVVQEGKGLEVNIILQYNGSTAVVVEVIVPKWFVIKGNNERRLTLSLNPNEEKLLTLVTNKLPPGKYSGEIYILYKGTIIQSLSVEFEVTPSVIPLLLIVIPSLLLLAIGVYRSLQWYRSKEKNKLVEKKVETPVDTALDPPVISSLPIPDFVALEAFMDERDLQIIEFIHLNNGTNQQAISDSLDISKATLSRIVRRLVDRGLVLKESNGMSNRLYLNYENIPVK